jgi:HK97 family phage portal protein
MGDLADFLNMVRGRATGEKGLTISHSATLEPGGFVTELRDYRRPGYPNASTADLLDARLRNELVFACLAIKASTAQDPRLVVQKAVRRKGKTEYEEIPGHPMRALLMRPNPSMTEADLMKAALISWDISNPRKFFCEREETRGLLTALHPLNPAHMRPLYSRVDSRRRIGYEWNDGEQRREYDDDELLIRSAPAWYDPPPGISALGSMESDSAQTDYVRAFFENGGTPPGLLKYDMPLNDDQRDEIRGKWKATYGNSYGRQHDIGVLDSNVTWQATGSDLKQLSSEVLRSVAESRICMVYGVPPLIVYAYVGLLRATYSNLKEAWSGFWDATMSPAFKEWRAFWTWSLLTEFEEERAVRSERVRLDYDMSRVAALQEDVDAISLRARENWKAGLIQFNEARTALGLPPDPERENEYRQSSGVMTGTAEQLDNPPVVAPVLPAETEDDTQDDADAPAKGRKARDSGSVQSIERRMERALTSYLAGQYRQAAQNVRAGA